jgi:threonine dehydrogenase-like Zn-dependent dehydrogenase
MFRKYLSFIYIFLIALALFGGGSWLLSEAAAAPMDAQGRGGGSCFAEYTGDNTTDFSSGDASAVQAAVDAAIPGSVVKVAGTCAGVLVQASLTQTVYISKDLTLQGGFTNTTWTTSPDPTTYPTVLDAEASGRVIIVIGSGVAVERL